MPAVLRSFMVFFSIFLRLFYVDCRARKSVSERQRERVSAIKAICGPIVISGKVKSLFLTYAICNSCYPCEITAHVLTVPCHRRRQRHRHREKSIRKAGKTRATSSIRIRRNRRNKKIRHEKRNRLNCVQNACTRCVAS